MDTKTDIPIPYWKRVSLHSLRSRYNYCVNIDNGEVVLATIKERGGNSRFYDYQLNPINEEILSPDIWVVKTTIRSEKHEKMSLSDVDKFVRERYNNGIGNGESLCTTVKELYIVPRTY